MSKKESLRVVRGIIREIIQILIHSSLLFLIAWRWNWLNAWICTGLAVVYQLVNSLILLKYNPSLLTKRGVLINNETKQFDRIFVVLYLILALSTTIISGLDAGRFRWTFIPIWGVILGIIVYIFADIIGTWAMVSNKYFEATVRIEENHQVCSTGPYRYIRHPGYLATILGTYVYVIILASLWALIPASLVVILFIVRTALEDDTLMVELPGYKAYSQQTKYRLLPYIW